MDGEGRMNAMMDRVSALRHVLDARLGIQITREECSLALEVADALIAPEPQCAPEPQPIGLLTERLARLEDRVAADCGGRAHEAFAETATAAMRRVLVLQAADGRMRQRVTALENQLETLMARERGVSARSLSQRAVGPSPAKSYVD